MGTKLVVASHGHCFDGMASAALFTYVRRHLDAGAEIDARYKSCGYGPQMSRVPEDWLDGEENAILDFRYTPSKRLTWYFDHHVTGFSSDEERASAEAKHVFFDPTYGSCTKLISDVARAKLGVDCAPLAELVAWADTIDAARFASAEAAIDRSEPVLQLASVVEHHGDTAFYQAMVPRLVERPLSEIARADDVKTLYAPIAALQQAYVARVKKSAKRIGRVVLVDLADAPVEVAGKFVTYALYPDSVYSVTVSRSKQHAKVSVGYNPWSGAERDRDIASICRRYGGGGHAVVGAASFPLGKLAEARAAAEAIARELAG